MRLMKRLGWQLKRLGGGSKRGSKSKEEERGRVIIGKFSECGWYAAIYMCVCVWIG